MISVRSAISSLAFLIATALITVPSVHAQNTYTVDSNGDLDDINIGNGVCATKAATCTLRAAIQEANATSNNDTIEFDIPQTGDFAVISPSEEYTVTQPVSIDATTAPEYPSNLDGPSVVIDGSSLSSSTHDGIEVKASNVTVQALGINNFPDDGIQVFSGNPGATIIDCFIGVAVDDGTSDRGNLKSPDTGANGGIVLESDDFTLDNNVISHNNGDGVHVDGSGGLIVGTVVGLHHDGDAAGGNTGVGLRIAGGSNNVIGFGAPNVVSGNGGDGIVIESQSNSLLNTYVGTDATGTTALGNAGAGIVVLANDNDVFDMRPVSGNAGDGILVGLSGTPVDNTLLHNIPVGVNESEDATIPNAGDGIEVRAGSGTTISDNVIGGNGSTGIEVDAVNAATDARTTIVGNYVGTNTAGDDLGNDFDGLQLTADPSANVREIEVYGGNVVGHNGEHGMELLGAAHDIAGNYVGTNSSGDNLGNGLDGIQVRNANGVAVGNFNIHAATGEDVPNVIGFNGSEGIFVQNATDQAIRGNYIGTNDTGADLGNAAEGVEIVATSGNSATGNNVGYVIGGSIPSDPSPSNGEKGNEIAYNGAWGVLITGDGDPTGNDVRGNLMHDNSSGGISLSGTNGNDNGDTDDGPNRGQNYPVISEVTNCDDGSSPTTVDVTFEVRSNTGGGAASQYPLYVDFYVADSPTGGEGQTYIQTEQYGSSNAHSPFGVTLSTDAATCDDHFVATATDDRGNTSPFFAPSQQLPVELASFDAAQSSHDAVQLTWRTVSETNSAGFEVQRRAQNAPRSGDRAAAGSESGDDGWMTLGRRDGAGTTERAQSYRFVADGLSVGTHQFRLKQIDVDGSTHVHEPVTVTLEMQTPVRLEPPAPNPVHGQTTLSFAVKDRAETAITLYNTLGQKVATLYRGTPPAGEQQTVKISGRDLQSGTYFVRVRAGTHTKTRRLVVVR